MTMLRFECDYLSGAHPAIIERLAATNLEQVSGYGHDPYSEAARAKIKDACGCSKAQVHFLVGGTQANSTVIDAILRPWQGVISAATGHIATHEAGAIEAGGHKVIELPSEQGKLSASTVEAFIKGFYSDPSHDHMPTPALIYISHPSEYGTLYSLEELEALRALCDAQALSLFMDGARLGYALAAPKSDVALEDIARLCDVFTIGGTKVGALCGEAVVFTNDKYTNHFFTLMKQHGAVLAKGRLLGLQFDTLFTNGLYLSISKHALEMAMKLKAALERKGYAFYVDSPSNQQFVILSSERAKELSAEVGFDIWGTHDKDSYIVRFATSWATREEDVDALIALL